MNVSPKIHRKAGSVSWAQRRQQTCTFYRFLVKAIRHLCTRKICNVFLASGLLFGTSSIAGQTDLSHLLWNHALPPMEVYQDVDYKGWKQIWGIVQGIDGRIYAANGEGVLQFDGVDWRTIHLPFRTTVRDLQLGRDSVMYVAASEEFGCLLPDSSGFLSYHSLKDRLDTVYQDFGTIWNIHPIEGCVYFFSTKYIFQLIEDEIKVIRPGNLINFSFRLSERVFYEERDIGLMEVRGDTMELFREDLLFTYLLLENANGSILRGSPRSGFSILTEEGSDRDLDLTMAGLYGGIKLSSGLNLAYSLQGGILVFDDNGRIRNRWQVEQGLPSNVVYHVFEDRDGSIWVSTDQGIVRIDLSSSVRILDERQGLDEWVHCFGRYRNRSFVGMVTGLYELNSLGSDLSFGQVDGAIKSVARDMVAIGDDLIISNFGQVAWLDPQFKVGSLNLGSTIRGVLAMPGAPQHCIAYTQQGYIYGLIKNGGKWQPLESVIETGFFIGNLIAGPDQDLWLSTLDGFVHRYLDVASFFEGSIEQCQIATYQLGNSYCSLGCDGSNLFAANSDSLLKWNVVTDQFEPMLVLPMGLIELASENEVIYAMAKNEGRNDLYQLNGNNLELLSAKKAFPGFEPMRIRSLDNLLIVPGSDGMLIQTMERPPDDNVIDAPNVTRVDLYGNVFSPQTHEFLGEFPRSKSQIEIDFSSPIFAEEFLVQYQSRLVGYEDEWSAWSATPRVVYGNLPRGAYRFEVRATDGQQISAAHEIGFEILPPWYSTWWALLAYVALGFVLINRAVAWRAGQMRKEKLHLENVVAVRTSQLRDSNQVLEKQKVRLKQQAEQLQEADRLKSRLFTNISHEFRTPLTLIKGPIDQLMSSARSALNQDEISMISRNARRLLRLVNQLLDLARLESGNLPHIQSQGDIYQVVRLAASTFSSSAQEKSIAYRLNVPNTPFWTTFDRSHIEKIVYNLVGNALKFTPRNGSIEVTCRHQEGQITIEVKDDGVGIAPQEHGRIFERFYQVESTYTSSGEGTGIGLALVKELIDQMGGSITLQSSFGLGSTFTVQIPLKQLSMPIAANEELIDLLDDRLVVARLPEAAQSASKEVTTGSTYTLLIVDDNSDMLEFLARQFTNEAGVIVASSGAEGLVSALEHVPDLIITDLMMPEMDGLEFCELLKTDERTSHIPVIILTARSGLESRLAGLDTGADAYLTKPFEPAELLSITRNLIAQRKVLMEKFSQLKMVSPRDINWPKLDQQFLQKLMNLFEENHADPNFGTPEIISRMAMSKTQLHRKVKALTSSTPGLLLRNFRIKRAAQIIKSGENVTQAAYASGFTNLSYFAKCFREQFDVNPGEYARR